MKWASIAIVGIPVWLPLALIVVLVPLDLLLFHSVAILVSCVATLLYLYLYNFVESKCFESMKPCSKGCGYVHKMVLGNRVILFCLFMLLQGSLLARWDLYTTESDSTFSIFWMAQVFILIKGLNAPPRPTDILGRKRTWVNVLLVVFAVGLASAFMAWGAQLDGYEVWDDAVFAIMMAVLLGAIIAVYNDLISKLSSRHECNSVK